MLASAALATLKITVGMRAHSTAVVSDGFESAGDVLASGLVLFGLLIAARPPDKEHPYGHGRFEILTALAVGAMLTATGVIISWRSLELARAHEYAPAVWAIWPLVISIVVKSAGAMAKRYYGLKIRSAALVADASNDSVDVLSATTALVALGFSLWNPVRFAIADHFGGFAVGLIVMVLGLRVVRDTISQLMDTMPDAQHMAQIRHAALSVPGALGIEKCFARKTGLQYHVDLHLEVDPGMTVLESHEIATQVRERIREKLDWVADVLVHVEPHMMATITGKR